ncbi:MAG: hypothetical protein ACYDC2_04665 [Solirubrobacteraceae bacterium]
MQPLRRIKRAAAIAACSALALPALSAPALAAPAKPGATTAGAKSVTFNAATLTGSVNPNGQSTSYYFQFGPTRAYGGQSAIGDAGAGTKGAGIQIAIGGLQPITLYHYRLVAVNPSGATLGEDRTFLTTKVPLTLGIVTTPDPVLFGGPVVIQGTLSGTDNASRPIQLQADAFPYTTGFQVSGNTQLTTPTGHFEFTILGQAVTTHYRVVTLTKPPLVTPEFVENVQPRIAGHIGHARKRGYVRFYGTVAPAADGMQVGIMKISHGRNVLVGGTVLKHAAGGSVSSFSKPVRVQRGVYRVLVRITNGAQISAYSQPLVIR